MTCKDYIRIAELARNAKPRPSMDMWSCRIVDRENYLKETICPWLLQDNPRFDRERFLAACGVDTESGE